MKSVTVTTSTVRRSLAGLAIASLAALGVLVAPMAASADTLEVTSLAANGPGSLADVLASSTNGDTIVFDETVFDGVLPAETIALETGIPLLHGVTIIGPGSDQLIITRAFNFNYRFISVSPGLANFVDFSISGLTFDGSNGIGTALRVGDGGLNVPNNVTIDDVSFINMHGGAGAVWLIDPQGTVSISNSTFRGNESEAQGGAIYGRKIPNGISITDTVFNTNEAMSGGAVYLTELGGDVIFTGNSVTNSVASGPAGEGGAVYLSDGTSLIVTDSSFDGSTAVAGGGAIAAHGLSGSVTIAQTDVFQNDAGTGSGGALRLTDVAGELTVTDSRFANSVAEGSGGAIYVDDMLAASAIAGSVFVASDSGEYGGAVYVDNLDAEFTVHSTRMAAGSAGIAGGGIAVGESNGTLVIDSSALVSNEIAGPGLPDPHGTSIYVFSAQGSRVEIVNTTIDDQESTVGDFAIHLAGVVADDDEPAFTLSHSTVRGLGGVVIDSLGGTGAEVSHTIIETPSDWRGIEVSNAQQGAPVALSWSLFSTQNLIPFVNDIEGNQYDVPDMGLGDVAVNGGPTPTRLPALDSPAFAAGNPALVGAPEFDQRGSGFDRVVDRIEIGAVEIQADPEPTDPGEALPATGLIFNQWIPIVAGILLVLGIAAIVYTVLSRRRLRDQGEDQEPSDS